MNIQLVANVATAMQLVYNNIATNATAVGQLQIKAQNPNYDTITFTNSPFITAAPPNPF